MADVEFSPRIGLRNPDAVGSRCWDDLVKDVGAWDRTALANRHRCDGLVLWAGRQEVAADEVDLGDEQRWRGAEIDGRRREWAGASARPDQRDVWEQSTSVEPNTSLRELQVEASPESLE